MTYTRRTDPKASTTRNIAVPFDFAERLDRLAMAANRNRSEFLRDLITRGLTDRYGEQWTTMADALKEDEKA